ncbi:MAG: F0F1 ATP synthase subunit delta [Candidatus Saccharimonadales bacterium]
MNLPSSISSLQELNVLGLELREYSKWFAHNAIKERVHAKNATLPPALSAGASELMRSSSTGKLLSQTILDTLIKDIEMLKKTAPSATITLAAPVNNQTKLSLVGACRTNIENNLLVTFKFNSTLCGGMVIQYGSRVFDWSFRRQILENRAQFTEILKRV